MVKANPFKHIQTQDLLQCDSLTGNNNSPLIIFNYVLFKLCTEYINSAACLPYQIRCMTGPFVAMAEPMHTTDSLEDRTNCLICRRFRL